MRVHAWAWEWVCVCECTYQSASAPGRRSIGAAPMAESRDEFGRLSVHTCVYIECGLQQKAGVVPCMSQLGINQ